jgi:hypothetical protein
VPQYGSPSWVPNFARPEAGCNWIGVAGQIFDLNMDPMPALVVELGGTLDGKNISLLALTATVSVYGPGGYEFSLSEKPIESNGTIWVQVHDVDGQPLSEKYTFATYSECSKNLVVFNFVEIDPNRVILNFFLPFVGKITTFSP